jgi:hypothetical protein
MEEKGKEVSKIWMKKNEISQEREEKKKMKE